jgi:PAS domain S-box-containing protein
VNSLPPLDHPERLALLSALDLLRPHEDPSLDWVTVIASAATLCPTALVTFVGPEQQWIASRVGWSQGVHPLLESFCVHALASAELMQVPDATLDERFRGNPLVTGRSAVRFYAGQPIVFDRQVLGAVCVLDTVPRQLDEPQVAVLRGLAGLVSDLLRVRLERSRAHALSLALGRSQDTLLESEERYRLLWQTTTDAVVMIDREGRVLFANPAVQVLFGHAPDALVGQHLAVLQPPRLRPAHERAFAAYLQSGRRTLDWRATETTGLRADGSEFPLEIAFSELQVGGERQFAAFIRDITQRKRSEAELARREAQFRALTELSTDWYWELDAQMRFTFMSDGARRSGLVEPSQAIGKHPWEARSDSDAEHWRLHKLRLARHESFRDVEFIHRTPDGTPYTLQISGEPVFDAAGSFTGYRGVGRNVTEQRAADEARRILEAQLRESQKLEAVGVLAGGIAHDFNNIVAGILGNAQLALADLEAPHPASGSIEQIRKAGLRAREMVQQILTFARRRPRQLAMFDLHGLVAETLGLLRSTLPPRVTLRASLPEQALLVCADATQLEQVLINLATNAWQAMEGASGSIVIGAEEVWIDEDASMVPAGVCPGRHVHLYVQDDGPGMDEATRQRVFEPFFTTKPEGQGTGLGLAVVHGIVTGHGGAVTLESAPGAGSTFHVWLPVGAGTATAAVEPAVPAKEVADGAGRRVLYIDDDEIMAVMVPRLLEKAGYRVQAFCDAAEAVRRCLGDPAAFDVVVTDLNMPGLSGLEVARLLSAARPDLPILLGSGNLPQEIVDDADFRSVRGTFHKQNTIEELPKLLHQVLHGPDP